MSPAKLKTELDVLAAMSPAQLRTRWKDLSGEQLQNTPASLIQHLIAYRAQEKQLGKLPVQIERQLDRLAGCRGHAKVAAGVAADTGTGLASVEPRVPILHGTRFIREWNGRTIAVTAKEGGGFEWEGESYRSLSEIARKVTGAHWSGPRFFGLKKARR